MWVQFFVACACLAAVAADHYAPTRQCENVTTHSTDVQVEVTNCTSEHEHCLLHKGHNYTVNTHFTPTTEFRGKSDWKVFGCFKNFMVSYGRRQDACAGAVAHDGQNCTESGGFLLKSYIHDSVFTVSARYPAIKLYVRFVIIDRKTKDILLCIEIPIEIAD